ncbi:MAG: hypothetical protein EZS28_026628 [Streblomastix strix]|uniref:Uncharacterized protein n=1 Tax=Streblomastix strix TaxID=222440 RepID=A0A5J4V5I2_9EUKA|nr:MAG: hypothetical protein EZS28_026628 [Streblomastix strix]
MNLELKTWDTLVQHGEWNKVPKKWISYKKEMDAIYQSQFRYKQIFKETQIKAIFIFSESSTAVQDLATKRAGQALVVEVKKKLKQCHQLRIQTQTQHTPEVSNKIIDALNRVNAQGHYLVKKEVFRTLFLAWWITPALDLFATGDKNSSILIMF